MSEPSYTSYDDAANQVEQQIAGLRAKADEIEAARQAELEQYADEQAVLDRAAEITNRRLKANPTAATEMRLRDAIEQTYRQSVTPEEQAQIDEFNAAAQKWRTMDDMRRYLNERGVY